MPKVLAAYVIPDFVFDSHSCLEIYIPRSAFSSALEVSPGLPVIFCDIGPAILAYGTLCWYRPRRLCLAWWREYLIVYCLSMGCTLCVWRNSP